MPRVRFGLFEFNTESGELFREGRAVPLQPQPAKVLAALIEAQGQVVTREALRDAVWNDGTSVDFDRGLNFAIAQVRTALRDSAESPIFVRTVPRRGYQFLAPVVAAPQPTAAEAPRSGRRRWLAAALVAGVAAVGTVAGLARRGNSGAETGRIAVARFQNETGNPALDGFAEAVTDFVVTELTAQTAGRHGIIGNADILRKHRSFQSVDEIGSSLQAQYVVLGQVKRDGPRVRMLAHLIRMPEKTHLHVSRVEVDAAMPASECARRIVQDFLARLASPPVAAR